MSYLVLARKFRPQSFASILGQEHVTTALSNSIARNRVPHAILLGGPRGVGKTSCARVFAKALNCTGREIPKNVSELESKNAMEAVEPCGDCVNCKEIASSSSIAVREIDGASHNSVENVRSLIETLMTVAPPGSRYKIYIIDEVHMLSTAAFNALLKSLEEPPPNTVFIFATTEVHKIPETVISRCQRHDFRRLSFSVITESLKEIIAKEGFDVEEGVLEFIARKSQGGMRDSQSMLDQISASESGKISLATVENVLGAVDRRFFFDLAEAILNSKADRALELLDRAFSQSLDIRSFIGDFIEHWRNLAVIKSSVGEDLQKISPRILNTLQATKAEAKSYFEQVKDLEQINLERLFAIATEVAENSFKSAFPRYLLEAGVVKMTTLPKLRQLEELLSEIKKKDLNLARPSLDQGQALRASSTQNNKTTIVEAAKSNQHEQKKIPEKANLQLKYNPAWEEFLKFLKGQGELILNTFLQRASVIAFMQGRLELNATSFDVKSLKDPDMFLKLKKGLSLYANFLLGLDGDLSQDVSWDVVINEVEASSRESLAVAGSLVSQAQEEKRKEIKNVIDEAKSDPAVKAALEIFSGSKIEKISVIKESK